MFFLKLKESLQLPTFAFKLIGGGVLLVAVTVAATLYFAGEKQQTKTSHVLFHDRDFRRAPFDLMDARDVCLYQTKSNFGRGLLSSHLNNRSTYYDQMKKIYIVVMDIEVGGADARESAVVYCNVDPREHLIVYYKELFPHRGSILTRTIDFLTRML